MLHADWLSTLQKVSIHSSKRSAVSTSTTWSLVDIDDHLGLECQYRHEINWLQSKHDFFQPNRLNPTNPLNSTKGKTPQYFPQKNFSESHPTLIHDFNLQQKQSLRFKLISFNHGTKIFQEENHGRHDNHIPYRRR